MSSHGLSYARPTLLLALLCALSACGGNPPAVPPTDAGTAPDAARAVGDTGVGIAVDAALAIDAASPAVDSGSVPMCPPTAPTGMRVGDIAPDLTLMDCDGVEHSLHELCDRQAVWLFEFADWCPPCRSFASSQMNPIYDRHSAASFEGWMVISADAGFSAPNAADCAEIRTRYGVTMPVLFDPTGALQAAFGVPANEVNIVLSRGARIEWVGQYAASEVDSRITAALAD